MHTSFPWTIAPHFRRDCKTEWGDGYCRGGRLCPPRAVTQHFVGQDPCALPGVEVPGSGVRAPRPTHHLPIEFHKGRRPPTVVPTDSRPLPCPLIGALSRNYPASLHILLCVVGRDVSIAPHDRLGYFYPGRAGGCLWLLMQEEGPRQCRGPSSSQYLFAVKIRRTACAVKACL